MQLSRNYFTPIILYFDTTLQITCGINFYTKQKYKKKKKHRSQLYSSYGETTHFE